MINNELDNYIKSAIIKEKTKEEIYLSLLNAGWKVDNINEYYFHKKIEKEEAEDKEDIQKRTIKIIVAIGAILIGAGIFSFIASNWEYMSKIFKIGILIASMLTAYISGWALREKLNYKKTGEALILLGSIIYGASIFLTAQIFNIRADWPDGFILWMIGIIIMAFAIDSFILFYLAIPLGIISFVSHPFIIFDRFIGHDQFLLTSTILLIIAAIISFYTAFTIRKKIPEELKRYY